MIRANRVTPWLVCCGLSVFLVSSNPKATPSQVISESLPTPSALPDRSLPPPLRQPAMPQTLIARVTPIAGRVNVHLHNNIGTCLVFEAAGYTNPTSLKSGAEVVIRDLPTPATVRISRADGGLLQVQPIQSSQTNVLDIALNEASPLSDDSGVVRIQSNGRVLLNQ